MKKIILGILATLFLLPCLVFAAGTTKQINNFPIAGYATINGTHLNNIVSRLNNITGYTSNDPQNLTGSTLTLSGTTASAGSICATFFTIGAPAAATDTAFFVATRAMRVVSVSEVHAVAAGGASVVQVTKDTGTNAPGAGTDLLTNNTNGGFDLNATANTVQVGALVATSGVTTLAAGDRLSVDFAQAIQSSSGIAITACMAPL